MWVARRSRADHYRARGALQRPRAARSTRTLGNMKALLALGLIVLSLPAFADPAECRLNGVWKSDAARTLADIAANQAMSPRAMSAVSADLFGHMTHEWTCSTLRAWFDYQSRADAVPYKVLNTSTESIVVTFPDGSDYDLRLVFEGECYKIRFSDKAYHEYFCPVAQP